MPAHQSLDGAVPVGFARGGEPVRRDAFDELSRCLVTAGNGDDTAFDELYDEMAPRVFGVVLRVLGDPHQSEEVAQEVFLSVWQNSARFDPCRGSAVSWVMTMAHRRAVDRVRSSEASRRRDASEAALMLERHHDVTADVAHASLEAVRVRAGLATLSQIQRRAVELAYFGGCTHSEVARLLQIPLGTAKTRIRDGLIALRDVLTPTSFDTT